MTVLNTVSFEDTVDLVNREFTNPRMPTIPNIMRDSGLFKVTTIPGNTGGQRRHKERLVSDIYAKSKTEGGRGVKTRLQQGYYKDTTSKTYSMMFDVTYEARMLDKTGAIEQVLSNIGNSYENREDLNLSMFLSYASATSYTNIDGDSETISCGDGLAIYSASHTLTGSSSTYSTVVTGNPVLAEGSLEVAEDVLRTNTLDNLGNQRTCQASILFTTDDPATMNEAARILQSTAQISSANSGVTNVYKGRYTHKVFYRMDMSISGDSVTKDSTKAKFWGLVDTNLFSAYHDVYGSKELKTPQTGNGIDIETLNWTWHVIGMHGSCVVSPRGMVMSRPS